ncbi:MAG: OpgC domain-containing protein, partial [Gluconacetobacter diazotrophicus]|nr:OpgC domain-containing protein [Gluconacetobacter diazotrophicus]
VVKLYLFQMAMMVTFIVVIRLWRHELHPVPVDFLEPELAHGTHGLWRVLILDALPGNLNILPLYIALLIAFPLMYWGLTRAKWLTLLFSAALWGTINLDPALNIPNWLDPDGWYFDPFAWQFLFVLGAWAAMDTARTGGDVPHRPILVAACWAYLLFSGLESFPWAQWHLPDLAPVHVPPPQKTPLSPLRLLDVMAIFYLVQGSRIARYVAEGRAGQVLAVYGRHSLEVFALGTVFDLFGRLLMLTWGDGWLMQGAVNVAGLGLLYLTARELDRRKRRRKAA